RIKGVILNKTSKAMYMLLKEQIEKHMDITVLGYLPNEASMIIESRHLGLLNPNEIHGLDATMDHIANKVEENIDLDAMIHLAKGIKTKDFEYPERTDLNVGIAYDEVFNFYYQENLKLLENVATVEYFSPLKDPELPKADLIYIGGGYPEIFKDELSKNTSM